VLVLREFTAIKNKAVAGRFGEKEELYGETLIHALLIQTISVDEKPGKEGGALWRNSRCHAVLS
jgi:hypothetical protein